MQARAATEDKTEEIKWADALDRICGVDCAQNIDEGLRLACECRHPDALWLHSLFPNAGADVTREEMLVTMAVQGEDPRAMFMCSQVGCSELRPMAEYRFVLLRRAAEAGFAPAQCSWATNHHNENNRGNTVEWLERAAAQGERRALLMLGNMIWDNPIKSNALYQEAAELGQSGAQFYFGQEAFVASDWQRYHWWGKSAARGETSAIQQLQSVAPEQLKLFEEGRGSGRIVFELGSAFEGWVDVAGRRIFGQYTREEAALLQAQRCIELRNEWIAAAKVAIECWLVVGRRRKIVKDIRLMIARKLWDEPWAWGGSK